MMAEHFPMREKLANGPAVFVFICIVFGAIALSKPPVIATDTPFYLKIADTLQSHPADVLFAKERATWTVLVLPALVIASKAIAPTSWPYIIVVVNVLSMAAAGAWLVMTVRLATRSVLLSMIALSLYVISFDVVVWMRYILTDCLFTAAATAAFYFLVRNLMLPESQQRRFGALCFSLFLSFITRASGAILIPVAMFSTWWTRWESRTSVRAKLAPWVLLVVLAFCGLAARAYVFADLRRWPTDFLRPVLQTYADREKSGQVVWDRVETTRTPPVTTADHFVLELDRFARFFQFTTPGFSRAHNAINVVYFSPLYLLAVIGLVSGLAGADRTRMHLVAVTALWVLSIAWLHAMTLLDFDWRYRLPVMPMLILLAACGVEVLALRFAGRTMTLRRLGA